MAPIFSCASHPTSLTARDLWDQNCSVAELLPSLPFPFTLHQRLLPKCTPHHGSHLLLSLPTHSPNGAGPVGPKLLLGGVPPVPSFPFMPPLSLLPWCAPHHSTHLLLSLPSHFPNGAGPVGPKLLRSGVPPVPSFPLHTPSAPSAEVHPTPRLTSSPVPPNPLP